MNRFKHRWSRIRALLTASVMASLVATALPAQADALAGSAQAQSSNFDNKAYSAYSHDIKTYLAGVVQVGPVVAAGVGCSSTPPLYFQNAGAGVSLAGVTVGAVTNSSQGLKSGTVQETRSTSTLTGVSLPLGTLLGGGLTADTITIRSSTFYDTATGQLTTSSSMDVVNLQVRLSSILPPLANITGSVAPNTGLDLGALGQLILHDTQQIGSSAGGAMGLLTRAVYVNLIGAAHIAIGENYSSLYGELGQSYMFGAGEALSVLTSDELLKVGPLVSAQVPCTGSGGVASQVAGTNGLPALLGSLGAVTSTGSGDRNGMESTATTTSEVASLNLLGGLITADAVGSQAVATSDDGGATVSTAGSGATLANLVIAGIEIDASTPPNTQITLPGIGYVTINEQYTFPVGIDVRALSIRVTAGNLLGLPSLDIVIGRSYAVVFGPGTGIGEMAQVEALLDGELTMSEQLAQVEEAFTDGTLEDAGLLPAEVTVPGAERGDGPTAAEKASEKAKEKAKSKADSKVAAAERARGRG